MNRLLSLLLVISIALTMAVFVSADNPASLQLGDTTGDGTIDAGDALEVLQFSVGKRNHFTAEGVSSGGGSGTPPVPPRFETVAELDSYIKSLTLPPEGFDLTQGFYNYLRPGSQDMLIQNRYYLLPQAPDGYTFEYASVYPLAIEFAFKNQQDEMLIFRYFTDASQTSDHITSQTAPLKQFNGMTYYLDYAKDGAYLEYDDYEITLSSEYSPSVTVDQLVEAFTFDKVTLPPLKTAVQ